MKQRKLKTKQGSETGLLNYSNPKGIRAQIKQGNVLKRSLHLMCKSSIFNASSNHVLFRNTSRSTSWVLQVQVRFGRNESPRQKMASTVLYLEALLLGFLLPLCPSVQPDSKHCQHHVKSPSSAKTGLGSSLPCHGKKTKR